jgi:hypothetical protein
MHFTQPPRRVPTSMAVLNVFNGFAQIGWFVFGFGMIFFWAFAGNADFSVVTFRGDIATTSGKVTSVEETGASENESPVKAHHYQYSVAGQWLQGTSYTTGGGPSVGEEVVVEYASGNPLRSRIEGMRRAQFGPWAIVVSIFPLIGLLILYFGGRGGFKRTALLRNGVFTTGKLAGKEPTNMTVNDRRVYELTFEFTTRDGRRCEATARSSDPSRLEDESEEPLLYDPDNPEKAYLLDEVSGRPEIDGVGELQGRPLAAALSLIIPAIVIGAHALYFWIKLK